MSAASQPLPFPELSDLPKGLTRGRTLGRSERRIPSGNPALDRLLAGGFPRGRLSEVFGAASSGRTSLAYGALAAATSSGEIAALVDCRNRFDPRFAAAAGIELSRLLWVRPHDERQALQASEILLGTHGLALVVLDLADGLPSFLAARFYSAWTRLARHANAADVALLLLSRERLAGSFAALCLGLRAPRALWPKHLLQRRIFSGIASRAEIVRQRAAAPSAEAIELRS